MNDVVDDGSREDGSRASLPRAEVSEESLRAPERAQRRAKQGLSLVAGTRVLAMLAPLASLAVVGSLAIDTALPPEMARAALPVVVDDEAERHAIDALRASMAALEERGRRFDEETRARQAHLLKTRLALDLPRVAAAIAAARDARKAADASRSLSAPFDASELAGAMSTLALVPGVDLGALPPVPKTGVAPSDDDLSKPHTVVRALLTRDGTFVLPRGSTSGIDVDLASTGTGEDPGAYTRVMEDGSAVVAARVCVPREKHCLYEAVLIRADDAVATAQLALAALERARENARERQMAATSLVTSARAPEAGAVVVARDRALVFFLVALALGLALALVATRRAARVGAFLAARTSALRATVHGRAQPLPSTTVPAEIGALDQAIDDVRMALDERRALVDVKNARGAALVSLATGLLALARGERASMRAPSSSTGSSSSSVSDDGDEPVEIAMHALGQLSDTLRARAEAIARALATLPDAHEGQDGIAPAVRADLDQRVAALRPFGVLLADIAVRTRALADKAEPTTASELMRLSEAVERRAKTADGLIDGLAQAVTAACAPHSHPVARPAPDARAVVERELLALGAAEPAREAARALA